MQGKGEDDYVGPNIYGRGIAFLRNKELFTPAKTTDREHLIMLRRANDMKIANTFSQIDYRHAVGPIHGHKY